jgi:hypothetical protein
MNQLHKKSIRTLAIWTSAWVLSTALATFGPLLIWEDQAILTAAVILANFLVGIGMIFANIHHITSLDEMLQKIHLQAMGITLGATLVAGISYSILDTSNLIEDAEISFLVIFMALTYMASLGIGYRRYR